MAKTVGELIKELSKYDENLLVNIEFYEEKKDFSWYARVFSVYEVKNIEEKYHEIIIEAD